MKGIEKWKPGKDDGITRETGRGVARGRQRDREREREGERERGSCW